MNSKERKFVFDTAFMLGIYVGALLTGICICIFKCIIT